MIVCIIACHLAQSCRCPINLVPENRVTTSFYFTHPSSWHTRSHSSILLARVITCSAYSWYWGMIPSPPFTGEPSHLATLYCHLWGSCHLSLFSHFGLHLLPVLICYALWMDCSLECTMAHGATRVDSSTPVVSGLFRLYQTTKLLPGQGWRSRNWLSD